MKNYCFGDSFIGMFTLVNNCHVFKFKGATAKGLSKPESETRRKILDVVSALNSKIRRESCFLFQFGSVDIHHSYYYKLLTDADFDPRDIASFINPIVDGYVSFIDSLNCSRKIILSPHYSPIDDDYVIKSLINYNVIKEDPLSSRQDIELFLSREWRTKLVNAFCDRLHWTSAKRRLLVIDLRADISCDGLIHPQYKDQSKYSIHLIWETLILVYLKYLGKCGITQDHVDLSKLQDYIEDKRLRCIARGRA